jgi:thiosulfate/3-mercaptopyruvate sulfurtransferase
MDSTQTIVSPLWLKENLAHPEVKIIDCRFRLSDADWGFQEYNQSHIPNSYYLNLNQDLSSPVQNHGGRHPLPDSKLLAAKLAQIGIVKDKTMVVVYDDNRFAFASRVWWLMGYLGHSQVAILDGGWQEWLRLDYPTSNEIPDYPNNGNFIPEIQTDWVVNLEQVKQAQNSSSTIIIDARSSDRYRGEIEPIDPIAGSIPTAKNVFWQDMTHGNGKLKSRTDLESLWFPYQNYSEIIIYCGSGVTACVNIFALTTIDIHQCKLYVGGWSDYCSDPENFPQLLTS